MLALEGVWRLLGLGAPAQIGAVAIEWTPGSPLERRADRKLRVGLRPGFDGAIRYLVPSTGALLLERTVRINSLGLRGPEPAAPPAPDRILALGDSVTFGQGVSEDEAWPAALSDALGGREVLNAGTPSWNTTQEIRWLTTEGVRLSPAAIVLAFFENDLLPLSEFQEDSGGASLALEAPAWAARESGIRAASALLNWIGRRLDLRREAAAALDGHGSYADWMRAQIEDTGGWRRAEWALDDLQEVCEARRIRCVVALIPRLETAAADPLRDVRLGFGERASARGMEVVDLQPALAALPAAERLVMPADPHPSPEAHRRIAAAIAAAIRR